MSETRSDMLGYPRDGLAQYVYDSVYEANEYPSRQDPPREGDTRSRGDGLLPGEVTVDGRVIRFWVLPNGKLDSRNRLAILSRETGAEPGGRMSWGFANRLERALEEKYGNDYPRPTVLASTTAAIYIEDDPDGGVRYVREERP